ncbi:MerR family transcriptional regulator [Desertihabitans aurantiacus]|uniref:MerR family transcriptional regulator n=1 Tax=Desertihabitans aurantiacus TaxID=2282477 RepID=UPI000DF7E578|nr:MerR family transcriptional regulator [Desertihabitans aurantiacus]
MRMAELSARSGVPAATIRYYLREGLLAAGQLTSPNQAVYDDSHVRRLRLVRALLDVGGLSIEAAKGVIAAMEAKSGNEFAVLGQVQYGLTTGRKPSAKEPPAQALDRVDDLIARRGWRVRENNPARSSLASALATLQGVGREELLAALDDYAAAAEGLARREVEELLALEGEDVRAEAVIAATVLGDAVLSALRRLAQESALAGRFSQHAGGGSPKAPSAG